MSTIIILIFLALFLGLLGSQLYFMWQRPYLKPVTKLRLADWFKLQHQARQKITDDNDARRLNGLFVLSQCGVWLGVALLILSFYYVEAQLNLLLFPTRTAMIASLLLVAGSLLLLSYPLLWPTQSYNYWADHITNKQAFTLVDQKSFIRYRRHQIWATIGGIGLIVTIWLARVWTTSTEPLVVIEDVLVAAILAIPVFALITALSQLPYLQHYHYLTAKPGQVNFGQLNYRAILTLIKQQPELKAKVITAHVSRLIGYLFGIAAFVLLYVNILAPAFTVDATAVFPAAILALIALCILEAVGAIWPQKNYDYLHLLKTKEAPFTVNEPDRFDQFRYHLYYYHLSAAVVWVFIWVAIIGAYYYYA
ncbi:hypothetical protein [Lactiplantibacillus daowaiensis]|uniref:Integral membrane protein n=1 Tax=Lactiplantibacillus daowaiensis TaxID=2559918 RepID=A0ABW1S132_9LACO|nr:hypothetical protein [Lactiplantibacillus daowaiensis]